MLINATDPEEARIAVVEDGVLQELHVEIASRAAYLGNIYKGRVVNIEPSIGAAFVAFGGQSNGFLHASDVLPAYARDDFRLEDVVEGRARVDSDDGPDSLRAALADDEDEEPVKKKGKKGAAGKAESRSDESESDESESDEAEPDEAESDESEADEAGDSAEGAEEPRAEAEQPEAELGSETAESDDEPENDATGEPEVSEGESGDDDPVGFPEADAGMAAAAGVEAEAETDAEAEEATGQRSVRRRRRRRTSRGAAGADLGADQADTAVATEADEEVEAQTPSESTAEDAESDSKRGRSKRRRGGRRNDRARPKTPIDKLLRKGQEVIVQVTKEGIGAKGPTLTTFLSLPGRSLVLMPSLSKCGVSRKIDDPRERRRLKRIVKDLDETGNGGVGFIVRTNGVGKTKTDLQRDRDYLHKIFELIAQRVDVTRAPASLYQESDLVLKAMRDLFSPEIEEVVVDNRDVYLRIKDFAEKLMPHMADRIKLHELVSPLFHSFGIETEVEKLYQPRVELENGGSIVIDQTEALVAIDVNSGRFKPGTDLEETAMRTNLGAIPDIVRQLRLRDLGGLIMIDFIDMNEERHRRKVERKIVDELKGDRARIKVGRISPFGMLELTRQRVGPGLKHTVFTMCRHCNGSGLVRTVPSKSLSVLREVRAVLNLKGFSILQVFVSPLVNDYLVNHKRREIIDLEESVGKSIVFKAEQSYPIEVVHYRFLTADGQEARVAIPAGLGVKA